MGSLEDVYEKGKVWIHAVPFYQPRALNILHLQEHRVSHFDLGYRLVQGGHKRWRMVRWLFEPISGLAFR